MLDLVALSEKRGSSQQSDVPDGVTRENLNSAEWWLARAKESRSRPRHEMAAWLSVAALDPSWAWPFNASLAADRIPDLELAERYAFEAQRRERSGRTTGRMASALRAANKPDAAAAFAQISTELAPESAFNQRELCFALLDIGRGAEALDAARRAIALEDDQWSKNALCASLHSQANALASEDPPQARALLDEALSVDPSPEAVTRTALVFARGLNEPDHAQELIEKAHRRAPDNAFVARHLGRLLYRSNRHDEALDLLRPLFESAPGNPNVVFDLANALLESMRFAEAETAIAKHLEVSKSPGNALHILGHLYQDAGLPEDAEKAWNAALDAMPSYTKLHDDLALLRIADEKWQDASTALEAGLDKNPSCAYCGAGRVRLAIARGSAARGLELAQALAEQHPESPNALLSLAQAQRAVGDPRLARQTLDAIFELDPRDNEAGALLGEILVELDDAAGLEHLWSAVEHNPELSVARYDVLVRALTKLGQPRQVAEASKARSTFVARLEVGRSALAGFGSMPRLELPEVQANNAVAPTRVDADYASTVASDILILLELAVPDEDRALLESLDPALDFNGIEARIDDLFRSDPLSGGSKALPIEVDPRGVIVGTEALRALENDSARLREVLGRRNASIPGRHIHQRHAQSIARARVPFTHSQLGLPKSNRRYDVVLGPWTPRNAAEEALTRPETIRFADLSRLALPRVPTVIMDWSSLETLILDHNPIKAVPRNLRSLTALRCLSVVGTRLSEKQIAAIRKTLPQCEVFHVDYESRDSPARRTSHERELDTALAMPRVVFGNGRAQPGKAAFAKDGGTQMMAATAHLYGLPPSPVVVHWSARMGVATVYRRDRDSLRWSDVTPDVIAWEGPSPVPEEPAPRESELVRWEREHPPRAPWPEPAPGLAEAWRATLGDGARAPLKADALECIERVLGFSIPPPLATCLTAADGDSRYLSARDIALAWLDWARATHDMAYEDIFKSGSRPDARPEGEVTHGAYWLREWIPFRRMGSAWLALDGRPGPIGQVGQVIVFDRNGGIVRQVAPSLSAYLARVREMRDSVRTIALSCGMGETSADALHQAAADAIPGDGYSLVGVARELVLILDWKAALDDLLWNVQNALKTRYDRVFDFDFGGLDPAETMIYEDGVLEVLDSQLRAHGFQLSSLESPGDDYLFLVHHMDRAETVIKAAQCAFGWNASPIERLPPTTREGHEALSRAAVFYVFVNNDATLSDAQNALGAERQGATLVHGKRFGVELHITFDESEDVAYLAKLLAKGHKVPELAKCTRRFVVTVLDLSHALDEANTLIETQGILQELAQGPSFNEWNGAFLMPWSD